MWKYRKTAEWYERLKYFILIYSIQFLFITTYIIIIYFIWVKIINMRFIYICIYVCVCVCVCVYIFRFLSPLLCLSNPILFKFA